MADRDPQSSEPDWSVVREKLESDSDSLTWTERESLLPLNWRPDGELSPDLIAVICLLSADSMWRVRRRVAAALGWLPDDVFNELAARLTLDTHSYVRRDAERALDRRRRGAGDSRKRGSLGELATEYSTMERLYGSMPTRKARRIVEKHFDSLVGGTVHNMRGLLTPIKHSAEELQTLANSGATDQKLVNRHTGAIIARISDLEQFLDDMRAYAQATPSRRRRERIADLIREALDVARRYFRDVGHDPETIQIRLSVPESITAEVARHQVLSVFTNLLRNAFEAFRPLKDESGPFWISVIAEMEDDRITVRIEDNGVGFGEEDLRHIREFIPGYKTLKHDGTGFGLPTAKRYIEGHGGTLDIDSQVQAGTKVTIVLPVQDETGDEVE